MKKVIDYTDEIRETIITEQANLGFILVEDQRHFDGNYLVFDDGKPERDLAAEIDDLKVRIKTLEKK